MGSPAEPRRPQRTRVYESNHLDSPRWDVFETRPGDIVITTAYKSGTTWMQTIVANLLFPAGEIPGPIMDIAPWIDMRIRPFDEILETTAAQTHRRFLKTHLALDGLPYQDHVKYVYVGRDLRDVFMSLWNHYSALNDEFYTAINDPALLVGAPMPRCPDDIHELWKTWVGGGWFEWEEEGYPYWSSSHHAQTWWDYRHLENILFVHFADLLEAPGDEIRRVADFLEIDVSRDALPAIVDAVSFDTMKKNSDAVVGEVARMFTGGSKKFINKGTNGRWRGVLNDEELGQYGAMLRRALSPDCARWLEGGRRSLSGAANP
jgi:aryl sulfotransferase